jgi:glucokinase
MNETGDTYITGNKLVSGRGISYVHQYLTGEKLAPEDVMSRMVPATETLEWAARFYGRACRNFALEALSRGGMYISGGVAARTPGLVKHALFAEEFVRSDTMADILAHIPVFLIQEQNAGLWGGAVVGQQKLKEAGILQQD